MPARPWLRQPSTIAALSAAAAGGATAGALGVGLYGVRLLVHPGSRHRANRTVELTDVTGSHVWLSGPQASRPGLAGFSHPGGYVRLGPPEPDGGRQVRRLIVARWGQSPAAGQTVDIDDHLYGDDGAGLPVRPRWSPIPSPAGPLPAEWFDADPTKVAIHVHGRGSPRQQCYRLVPTFHEKGWTSLVVGYRNDPDAPEATAGTYGLGATEWRDLAAAALAARRHGAEQLVLVGWSMGAAAVAALMRRRPLIAELVDGVVLDSPALEWTAILRHIAKGARLPGWLVPLVVTAGRARAGLDWNRLDHISSPDHLARPMVLVHGDVDRVVPVDLSDVLAGALGPDNVEYLRVPGADHTRAFNHDPARYAASVAALLDRIPAPPPYRRRGRVRIRPR